MAKYKIINDDGTESEIDDITQIDEVKNLTEEKAKLEEEYKKLQTKDMNFGKFEKKSQEAIDAMDAKAKEAYLLAEARAKEIEEVNGKLSKIEEERKIERKENAFATFGIKGETRQKIEEYMKLIANDDKIGTNEDTFEGLKKKIELAGNMMGVQRDFSTAGSSGAGGFDVVNNEGTKWDTDPKFQALEKKFVSEIQKDNKLTV